MPAMPALPAEVVAASAGRNLPSTRAGGQDDVSLNKLPQNNVKYNKVGPERAQE